MVPLFYLRRRVYPNYFRQCQILGATPMVNYSQASAESPLASGKLVVVQNKVYDFMKWYEQLTGIDEIRIAQNKVIEAQERFGAAQEKRREVTLELNEIKNKIKDLQEELSTIPRGEERYITLITKEHKMLKEEIRLTDKFNLYEREERELFTTLTSSVKESHEKERIQANKTKYLSIIGSIFGALIGIIGSTINNRSKMAELRKMVVQTTEESKAELTNVCKQLEKISQTFSTSASNHEIIRLLNNLIEKLEVQSASLDDSKTSENVEVILSRFEKKINSVLNKVGSAEVVTEPHESIFNSDFERSFPYLYSFKDDVSYALISCFSVYCLYRLFFP